MPIYTVQAPDGRTVRLEGETPPTEADLDQVFAGLPAAPQQPAAQRTEADLARQAGFDPSEIEALQQKSRTRWQEAEAKGEALGKNFFTSKAAAEGLTEGGRAATRATAQGLLFGFGDEAEAMAAAKLKGTSYEEEIGRIRGEMEQAREETGGLTTGLEVASSLIPGVAGAKAAMQAGTTLGRIGRGVGIGALQSGAAGAGAAEGGVGQRAIGAGVGAGIGGVTGGVFPAVGAAGREISERVAKYASPTLGQVLGEGTMGQLARGAEKFLGQSLIFGQPLRNVAKKQIEETQNLIKGLSPKASDTLEAMGGKVSDAAARGLEKIRRTENKLYQQGVYNKILGGETAPADASNVRKFIDEIGQKSPVAQEEISRLWSKYDKPDLNISQLNDFKQQIGSTLNKAGVKLGPDDKYKLYNAAKTDFYNSVRSAAPPEQQASVIKNLARGDKYYSRVKQTGIGQFLEDFAGQDEFTKASTANQLLMAAREGKRESFGKLNALMKRASPQDADMIKQNLIRHTMIPYGKESYQITTAQVADRFNDMPDKTQELLFGKNLPTVKARMEQFRKLGNRPLNPSGTAAGLADLAYLGGVLGLGGEKKQETAMQLGGAGLLGAMALRRPGMAGKTLQAFGLGQPAALAMTPAITRYLTANSALGGQQNVNPY